MAGTTSIDTVAPAPPSTGRTMLAAVGATLLAMMPAFVVGGLSVFVQTDLGLDDASFGFAISCFFVVSGVCSVLGGIAMQRIRVRRAILIAPAVGLVAMLGLASFADSLASLAAFMALGGLGNAITQPAANRGLSHGVPHHRQGLAFGIKQSAVPICSVLAGLAVPVIAHVGGWRLAVAGAAVLAYLLVLSAPHGFTTPQPHRDVTRRRRRRGPLVVLSLGAGFATAGTTVTGVFLVQTVVAGGLSIATGGLLLATGNVLAIVMRVGLGWVVDRIGDHVWVVLALVVTMAAGGFVTLSLSRAPFLVALGAVVGSAMTSGWQGLFNYGVVRNNPAQAAAMTGITQTGIYTGGIVGPLVFSQVALRSDYSFAWLVMAALSTAGATLLFLVGHRRR